MATINTETATDETEVTASVPDSAHADDRKASTAAERTP
eukprot:CAMPEP_0194329928 /NCGR_PEP_ID=MMETSP0171-20130528/49820_1 /TAXON_ID=218684 /ORGANISM="Corethron pennatum, Strain L29A3" /LENGTH=38 /DNA_ID= /DNA_START= /DNA_END= /DNA_ORIENTATION=